MSKKKLMLLGGLRYLLPVIEAARNQGYHIITCDYLPDNVAHKYSDEYHNVSITDKEAVLSLARQLKIDGIMSFAVDPGVITAAYVQEKMGLPQAGPYESVCILQNKDRFRSFLEVNGFNVPKARGYKCYEEVVEDKDCFEWPVIVKPVDSAGSKGVTKVETLDSLKQAVEHALACSISKRIIVEEFIEKKGCSSDSDCFSVNGEMKFISFSDQMFDENADNPYTPAAYIWPSTMDEGSQKELSKEIQRLVSLLGMKTSIYNVETRVGTNGKPYIMELSPRGGGNRLSEMLRYATSEDLIEKSVKAAVGENIYLSEDVRYDRFIMEVILHAERDGIFKELYIEPEVRKRNVIEEDLWVRNGDKVRGFKGANDAVGTLVLGFNSKEEMNNSFIHLKDWLKVLVS